MVNLLILGGTGLVGQQLIHQALDDASIARVIAPTRRPLAEHAKLTNPIVDFDALPSDAAWWAADAVICALGTTMRQAGSRAAFNKVDHDYVLAAARQARYAGTPVFVLNSSAGANPSSRSYYLRVKGNIERDLALLNFASLTLVRPSLLIGGPRPERRIAEEIGIRLMSVLAPLIPARYRGVSTADVAACILAAARQAGIGVNIIESEAIRR
ncbi:NAD(P)H-binding protein [Lacisediminimonas sp.]|uniref:NAD(P)H-binding protein n=1 Tax=Lacisediminimonas sp. TaxID=3060582 RepID=UPI0027215A27|nr:NAD(P)H-binding protein [Lacisediminimonas sp.]MDO8298887.1 NAD(P)H-binding protein [Lacisediminimonas sp.]